MSSPAPSYRLVRPAATTVVVPALDEAQRRVVDHRGGPLLVLAGPGTGKTTTVVEAVVARIEAGADPEQVLVLTFGRRAAAELRDPHHHPARPRHQGAAGPHLPLLRVRRAPARGGAAG